MFNPKIEEFFDAMADQYGAYRRLTVSQAEKDYYVEDLLLELTAHPYVEPWLIEEVHACLRALETDDYCAQVALGLLEPGPTKYHRS